MFQSDGVWSQLQRVFVSVTHLISEASGLCVCRQSLTGHRSQNRLLVYEVVNDGLQLRYLTNTTSNITITCHNNRQTYQHDALESRRPSRVPTVHCGVSAGIAAKNAMWAIKGTEPGANSSSRTASLASTILYIHTYCLICRRMACDVRQGQRERAQPGMWSASHF